MKIEVTPQEFNIIVQALLNVQCRAGDAHHVLSLLEKLKQQQTAEKPDGKDD
jgi:hypothetical protein